MAVVIMLFTACSSEGGDSSVPTASADILRAWNASLVDVQETEPTLDEEQAIASALAMVYPESARVVGTRLLQVEPGEGAAESTLAWAIDFDASTGDLNYRENAGFHVLQSYLYYALVLNAGDGTFLFEVFGGPQSPVYREVEIAMSISNVDGPDVLVSPWDGAGEILLECGRSYVLAAKDAPDPPWHLLIRNAATGEIMRDDEIGPGGSSDVHTTIRGRTVITGSSVGSGPASAGCPTPTP